MKKLLIGLAAAGLFSGAGIALACDYQNDASVNVTPMSKVAPIVIACDGGGCPAPRAIAKTKRAKHMKADKPAVVAVKADECQTPPCN